jgi:hypothetical protein
MRIKDSWDFDGVSIPGYWIHDNASPDGLRFRSTKYGWAKLRAAKCEAAESRCQLRLEGCLHWAHINAGELHHTGAHGRGIGGSWREDRETVWTCKKCHEKAESVRQGPRWGSWAVREG